jgi:hypothetical protein
MNYRRLESWELKQIERFATELAQCASRAVYIDDVDRLENLTENALYRLTLLNEILGDVSPRTNISG